MNAIRHNRIGVTTQADGSVDIVVPASMVAEFQAICRRGTNTAPDVHVEIRDFMDRLLGREKDVGMNMKWELETQTICDGHPETCNCPVHG